MNSSASARCPVFPRVIREPDSLVGVPEEVAGGTSAQKNIDVNILRQRVKDSLTGVVSNIDLLEPTSDAGPKIPRRVWELKSPGRVSESSVS